MRSLAETSTAQKPLKGALERVRPPLGVALQGRWPAHSGEHGEDAPNTRHLMGRKLAGIASFE